MTPEEKKVEIARLDYESFKIETNERMKYQADLAHAALRGLTLTNGGAIVALFTFIGNTSANFDRNLIWWAFGLFVCGLICTLAANIGGFLAQSYFFRQTVYQTWNAQSEMLGDDKIYDPMKLYKVGMRLETSSIIIAILALVCFIIGSGFALAGVL